MSVRKEKAAIGCDFGQVSPSRRRQSQIRVVPFLSFHGLPQIGRFARDGFFSMW